MGRARAKDPAEPLARLVRFAAPDESDVDIDLSGLLYEPRRSTQAAIFLHGMGGSFEPRRTNLLGARFVDAGIAFFAFNNRGSYLVRRLGRGIGGMAYERIRECVADIDGAIRELRRRGYRDLTLIGHSTGANKIAVYDHYKKRNVVKRYVLAGGGDDTGLAFAHLGTERRFRAALDKARRRMRERRGDELVPASISSVQPLSWRSFYDLANPDGDYNVFPFLEAMRGIRLSRKPRFRYLRGIRKPALAIWGEADEYCYGDVSGCVAALAGAIGSKSNFELAIMKDADHGFAGFENALAQIVIAWIRPGG